MIQIGAISSAAAKMQTPKTEQQEKVSRERKAGLLDTAPRQDEKKVASEEVLKRIKELADGGLNSVRFEMDPDMHILVVKVYDSKTEELLRQIPAEALLGTTKALQEYRRGLVVNDKG